jgi:hypothetical protein
MHHSTYSKKKVSSHREELMCTFYELKSPFQISGHQNHWPLMRRFLVMVSAPPLTRGAPHSLEEKHSLGTRSDYPSHSPNRWAQWSCKIIEFGSLQSFVFKGTVS